MAKRIVEKVTAAFAPEELQVINESHMHSGKAPESHFKLVVVAQAFQGQTIVDRHRSVNRLLDEELKTPGGIHALSLILKTPEQWAKSQDVPASPNCRGGSAKN